MMEAFEEKTGSLPEEVQQEVVSLYHSVAVLDLFTKEDKVKASLDQFLIDIRSGSETRQEILNGTSYSGDEVKLQLAIKRARSGYSLASIKRKALYEHALSLGYEAELTSKAVVLKDQTKFEYLSREHGNWRAAFASKQRRQERADYRKHLEGKIRSITEGEFEPEAVPATSCENRAVLIVRALNAIAHRSMLSGLRVAVADARYKDNTYDYYKEGTPHLDRASLRKFDRLYLEAQQYFWDANDYSRVISSGGMEEKLLRRLSQHEWDKFVTQFEFSPHRKHRDKYRQGLLRYIPDERLSETKID